MVVRSIGRRSAAESSSAVMTSRLCNATSAPARAGRSASALMKSRSPAPRAPSTYPADVWRLRHPDPSTGAAAQDYGVSSRWVRHDPDDPDWAQRDVFFLSNGHTAPVLYAALTHSGYLPAEELTTLHSFGSRLLDRRSAMICAWISSGVLDGVECGRVERGSTASQPLTATGECRNRDLPHATALHRPRCFQLRPEPSMTHSSRS